MKSQVLVASPCDIQRSALVQGLTSAGYSCLEAETVSQAEAWALESELCLAIVDLNLLHAERRLWESLKAPIVVLGAGHQAEEMAECLRLGALAALTKPVASLVGIFAQQLLVREQQLRSVNRELDLANRRMAQLNQRLSDMAFRDPLTGLYNRRYAVDHLNLEWASEGFSGPLSCIMLDIDHFKRVNDTLGHQSGDVVLCEVAKLLEGVTSGDVLAARHGGEEFVLLCVGMDGLAAYQLAEQIRTQVEQLTLTFGDKTLRFTISAGVVERKASMQDWPQMLERADQALYLAKELGRNQTQLFMTSDEAEGYRGTPLVPT